MPTSHVRGMSIGPTIARHVAMAAPQGTVALGTRVRVEATPSGGRSINWWCVSCALLETPITEITENRRACLSTYKVLGLDLRFIASRFADLHANPTTGGAASAPSQASRKALPKIPKTPKFPGSLSLVMDGRLRLSCFAQGAAETAGNAQIKKARQNGHRMASRSGLRQWRELRKRASSPMQPEAQPEVQELPKPRKAPKRWASDGARTFMQKPAQTCRNYPSRRYRPRCHPARGLPRADRSEGPFLWP